MKRNLPNLARVFTVRQERAERARHQASAESRRLAQEAVLANAAVQQAAARRIAALRQCDADPGNEQARLWRCWSEEQSREAQAVAASAHETAEQAEREAQLARLQHERARAGVEHLTTQISTLRHKATALRAEREAEDSYDAGRGLSFGGRKS